jgi:hypothetical protein
MVYIDQAGASGPPAPASSAVAIHSTTELTRQEANKPERKKREKLRKLYQLGGNCDWLTGALPGPFPWTFDLSSVVFSYTAAGDALASRRLWLMPLAGRAVRKGVLKGYCCINIRV